MENKEEVLKNSEELDSLSLKKQKLNMKKDNYKDKECKVIKYDKYSKTLDVLFDRFGIRIFNVESFNGNIAIIKYKGEIGKPDFDYRL